MIKMEDMAETKWRKSGQAERWEGEAKRDNLLISGPMGQEIPVERRVKIKRKSDTAVYMTGESKGISAISESDTHTPWYTIVAISGHLCQ